MKRAIIESPYKGNSPEERAANTEYARKCCAHAISLGFVPFASHLFFPQFLDEDKPEDRKLGIEMGYDFWEKADVVLFYMDRGMSPGMEKALAKAFVEGANVRKMYLSAQAGEKVPDEVARFAPPKRQPVDLDKLAEQLKDTPNVATVS